MTWNCWKKCVGPITYYVYIWIFVKRILRIPSKVLPPWLSKGPEHVRFNIARKTNLSSLKEQPKCQEVCSQRDEPMRESARCIHVDVGHCENRRSPREVEQSYCLKTDTNISCMNDGADPTKKAWPRRSILNLMRSLIGSQWRVL